MGTRSLTYFYNEEDSKKPFMCMYRQFDGYPEGHGKELGEFLTGLTIVNGFGTNDKAGTHANGMGCLAAQYIAKVKTDIGNHYIVEPELQQDGWQEFEYYVYPDRVEVKCCYGDAPIIFTGSYKSFLKWADNPPQTEDGDYIVTKATPKAEKKQYNDLNDALVAEEVTVTFRKADDSTRVMKCTKDANRIPEDALNRIVNGHKAKAPAGLYRVWDLEKQDWRSFKEERLVSWKVA